MSNEIKLVQSPVIAHKLAEAGKSVSERLQSLEIEKQIATVETIKSLKDLRAELNKELDSFEAQRKFIKEGVNAPYLEFENLYKVEISEKYKSAIELLKDKITSVELQLKNEKKQSIEEYFKELCVAEKIDFLKFENVGLEINLSTTEKKYKEQVHSFISKVVDDLDLIKTTDFEAEILTEYKLTLNVAQSITTVKNRKQQEEIEKSRIKAARTQNRIKELTSFEMNFVEITNAYEFNADIYISKTDVEELEEKDFLKKISECQVKIANVKRANTSSSQQPIENSQKEDHKEIPAPVSAPKVENNEPLKTASFQVTATMQQLRALGEYMKTNNITYKNI